MPTQRYEVVNSRDDEDVDSPITPDSRRRIPSSPPPSFHSRSSSPSNRRLLAQDTLSSEVDQNLNDAFDDGEESDTENDGDDRQRLMRANGHNTAPLANDVNDSATVQSRTAQPVQRVVTVLPTAGAFPTGNVSRPTNDGVFANLSAKPERGEQVEEKPPTYEQAAADATPPYWETTILAPGMSGDEVYVDGLPVGQIWSFLWNAMISTSFQLVGFLLTYLLHTSHAAKNGSRAGLGLTLVQYGYYLLHNNGQDSGNPGQYAGTSPPDPNSHSFDPSTVDPAAEAASSGVAGISSNEWISYILMIVGWFILIRSVSDYMRARRHEALILQSPTRGLSVPLVAEGEDPERVA